MGAKDQQAPTREEVVSSAQTRRRRPCEPRTSRHRHGRRWCRLPRCDGGGHAIQVLHRLQVTRAGGRLFWRRHRCTTSSSAKASLLRYWFEVGVGVRAGCSHLSASHGDGRVE